MTEWEQYEAMKQRIKEQAKGPEEYDALLRQLLEELEL